MTWVYLPVMLLWGIAAWRLGGIYARMRAAMRQADNAAAGRGFAAGRPAATALQTDQG